MSQKSSRHYATDWIFRNSRVTGIVRWVFVGIAQCMKGNKCETAPVPIEEIAELTGMGESTIRRSIKEIEDAGDLIVVKSGRRGTVHKYALAREVRLPLDVDPPQRSERALSVVRGSGESPPGANSVSGQSERSESQRSVAAVSASGALVQQASSPDLSTSTEELTTTSSSTCSEFLAWFVLTYPKHRKGVRYTVTPADFTATADLLRGRTLDRVQAMAMEMWADTEDRWIANGDRSPRVLRACAATFEDRVLAGDRRAFARLSPWEQARAAGLK